MTAAGVWDEAVRKGTPLVSPVDARGLVEVTFVWRGEAEFTEVGWAERHVLQREPGTDVWHGTFRLPANLRTVYHFSHLAPNTWQPPRDDKGTGETHIDLLNPRRVLFPRDPADPSDRDCWASLLTLPRAAPETWPVPQPGVASGTVEAATLDGGRVAVYRPPGERRAGLPAVVIFDGYLGRTMMGIPATLDISSPRAGSLRWPPSLWTAPTPPEKPTCRRSRTTRTVSSSARSCHGRAEHTASARTHGTSPLPDPPTVAWPQPPWLCARRTCSAR